MRLGAALPVSAIGGGAPGPSHLADSARLIEDAGYSSIWTFDAVGRGFMLPDPLMALSVAATVTEQVELGTGILQLPIRNVPEVAHRALTLHLVAGDRFLFGVGPGSTRDDFETFGAEYSGRFERFDAQWSELRSLLHGGGSGDHSLSPWPAVRGGPTLCLAGWRGGWVERAAHEAGAWIASAENADDTTLADAIERYRAAGGSRAVVTNVQVARDPAGAIDRLHLLASLGFDDAVVFDLHPTEERIALVVDRYREEHGDG